MIHGRSVSLAEWEFWSIAMNCQTRKTVAMATMATWIARTTVPLIVPTSGSCGSASPPIAIDLHEEHPRADRRGEDAENDARRKPAEAGRSVARRQPGQGEGWHADDRKEDFEPEDARVASPHGQHRHRRASGHDGEEHRSDE